MRNTSILVAAPVVLFASSVAMADTVVASYTFQQITQNGGAGNAAAAGNAGSKMTVEVIEVANSNQAAFKFFWNTSFTGSITDIYFDDGSLLGIASISNGPGVSFSPGASPGDLPGGAAVNFNTSAGFSADSDAPVAANGVQWASPTNEYVQILFNLQAGQTVDDVIAAIQLALINPGVDVVGGLRIGLHVQSFSDGQSQSFVIVPLPPAAWAGVASLAGVFGLGYLRRRSFRA